MDQNTSQSHGSTSRPNTDLPSTSFSLRGVWNMTWRVAAIAIGYMLASMTAAPLLGKELEPGAIAISFLSGALIGATLAPIAARVQASRFRHWFAWASVLFLNALSLAIEGTFFAPGLSPMAGKPVAWTAYLLFESVATAGLVAWLFGRSAGGAAPRSPRPRPRYSWAWRFLVSSFSYPLFYFIFGALNFALVTKPYYQAHVSGLATPAPQTVLMAEMVRAPLIVLSIVPLILLWKSAKRPLAVACGIILFVVGGLVPLLLSTTLPDLLRFASAIEIFFQNFLTGVVAAVLLGFAPMNDASTERS